MKKFIDVIIVLVSLSSMLFIAFNWNTVGYGWSAYFAFHWIISFFFVISWIFLFFRNTKSSDRLSYLSIILLATSILLDYLWMDKALR